MQFHWHHKIVNCLFLVAVTQPQNTKAEDSQVIAQWERKLKVMAP
jgi:hypothetical protein